MSSKRGAPSSSFIRNRSLRTVFKAAEATTDQERVDLKPHRSAFSGGPMPSLLSREYPILFFFAQRWAGATIRIAQGSSAEKDRSDVRHTSETFKRCGLDPRDFGFGNLTEFDVEVALANGDK